MTPYLEAVMSLLFFVYVAKLFLTDCVKISNVGGWEGEMTSSVTAFMKHFLKIGRLIKK
jgi:hypothetical protein